jgi:hypothetical protein
MTVYYSTRIFANIGLSDFLSQLLAAVMNTGFAMGTYLTPGTIEKFGRRPIMMSTAFVCGVSIMMFTIMISLPNGNLATQWVAVAFVCIYNFSYGYGWASYSSWFPTPLTTADVGRSGWMSLAVRARDRTIALQTYQWRCRVARRVAVLVHLRVCRWHRHRKNWLENMGLAGSGLFRGDTIRLLYVPRGKRISTLEPGLLSSTDTYTD